MSGTFVNIASNSTNGNFQTVTIGGASPHNGIILDIEGIGGVGFPILTDTQRDALNPGKDGVIIYNSDNSRFEVFRAGIWQVMSIYYHTDLSNLGTNDDHPQYPFISGRSGGQTINGDTASGGDLTLNSTIHATKGNVIVGGTLKNSVAGNETAASLGTAAVTEYLKVVKSNGSVRYIPLVTTPN